MSFYVCVLRVCTCVACLCVCVCVCVCLNGAPGPRLDNELRPFAVTPAHQSDRKERQKGKNKKAG